MDQNTNNTVSSVPSPVVASHVSTPNTSPAGSTAPSQNVEGQSAQTTQTMTQHKSKSMMWMIILLVLVLICGLALAGWYFQTQIHKF